MAAMALVIGLAGAPLTQGADDATVRALRSFLGATQQIASAAGDLGGLAGKSVTMDLPGLPSGAKKLELALIVPGRFTMGSPESEPIRSNNEGPQTRVTISKPFFIGKYEVTQGQWEAVMGSNPRDRKSVV